jgi:hypothetical protein
MGWLVGHRWAPHRQDSSGLGFGMLRTSLPSVLSVDCVRRRTRVGADRSRCFAANGLSTRGHPSAQPQRSQQLPFDAIVSYDRRMAASCRLGFCYRLLDGISFFDLENDNIVCQSGLIATLRNDFSNGALPAVCHPHRHGQNRPILRPVFATLLLAQPSGKTDSRCRLDHPTSLSRRYRQ